MAFMLLSIDCFTLTPTLARRIPSENNVDQVECFIPLEELYHDIKLFDVEGKTGL